MTMLRTLKTWMFLLCFATLPNAYASELTEESVNKLIVTMEDAVNTLDAQVVADALSNDVEITMHVTMQGQTQVLNPSKQEYIALLKQGWAQYSDYKHSRSNTVIEIRDDKAFVTADILESMSIQGQTLSGETKEELTIELVNGNPQVTTMTGYSSM